MHSQKSYLGKSPLQMVAKAHICEMAAGNIEIVSPDYPGHLLALTERREIVIANSDGPVAVVCATIRAVARMESLAAERETAYARK